MNIIASTLGRVVTKYRTLSEWAVIYSRLLAERQICEKTRQNRMHHVRRIVDALGDKCIGSIKPHEISTLINVIGKTHQVAAKRVLIEIRSMFYEAVANDWISTNPAKSVRPPRVTVKRRRLSLTEWNAIDQYARKSSPHGFTE